MKKKLTSLLYFKSCAITTALTFTGACQRPLTCQHVHPVADDHLFPSAHSLLSFKIKLIYFCMLTGLYLLQCCTRVTVSYFTTKINIAPCLLFVCIVICHSFFYGFQGRACGSTFLKYTMRRYQKTYINCFFASVIELVRNRRVNFNRSHKDISFSRYMACGREIFSKATAQQGYRARQVLKQKNY
jgi:hypothetical protein